MQDTRIIAILDDGSCVRLPPRPLRGGERIGSDPATKDAQFTFTAPRVEAGEKRFLLSLVAGGLVGVIGGYLWWSS